MEVDCTILRVRRRRLDATADVAASSEPCKQAPRYGRNNHLHRHRLRVQRGGIQRVSVERLCGAQGIAQPCELTSHLGDASRCAQMQSRQLRSHLPERVG